MRQAVERQAVPCIGSQVERERELGIQFACRASYGVMPVVAPRLEAVADVELETRSHRQSEHLSKPAADAPFTRAGAFGPEPSPMRRRADVDEETGSRAPLADELTFLRTVIGFSRARTRYPGGTLATSNSLCMAASPTTGNMDREISQPVARLAQQRPSARRRGGDIPRSLGRLLR
jgi:hypothetical protein